MRVTIARCAVPLMTTIAACSAPSTADNVVHQAPAKPQAKPSPTIDYRGLLRGRKLVPVLPSTGRDGLGEELFLPEGQWVKRCHEQGNQYAFNSRRVDYHGDKVCIELLGARSRCSTLTAIGGGRYIVRHQFGLCGRESTYEVTVEPIPQHQLVNFGQRQLY